VSAAAPDGRALLRAGRYPEAARAFASSTRAAGKSAAVIQLLIACSAETVQKAVDNASAAELFILPVNFKGRDCYRLCWGLYPSEARASSALRTVPEYFRIGGAAPRVVGAPEVAP
jgi:septal ring-binding cell division protein DamX